jgi:hypothetical protein
MGVHPIHSLQNLGLIFWDPSESNESIYHNNGGLLQFKSKQLTAQYSFTRYDQIVYRTFFRKLAKWICC